MTTMNSREESFGVDDIYLSSEDVEGIDWAELTQSVELFMYGIRTKRKGDSRCLMKVCMATSK